jgi:hypothetical protein
LGPREVIDRSHRPAEGGVTRVNGGGDASSIATDHGELVVHQDDGDRACTLVVVVVSTIASHGVGTQLELVVGGLVAIHSNIFLRSLIIRPRDGGPAGERGRWVVRTVEGSKRTEGSTTRIDSDRMVARARGR